MKNNYNRNMIGAILALFLLVGITACVQQEPPAEAGVGSTSGALQEQGEGAPSYNSESMPVGETGQRQGG